MRQYPSANSGRASLVARLAGLSLCAAVFAGGVDVSAAQDDGARARLEELLGVTARAMLLNDYAYAVHVARLALEGAHAVAAAEENEAHPVLIQALGGLGEAYRANHECRKALVILDRAVHLAERDGVTVPPHALASLYLWRGDCARQNGDADLAGGDFGRVYEIIGRMRDGGFGLDFAERLLFDVEVARAELLAFAGDVSEADKVLAGLLDSGGAGVEPFRLGIWRARARIALLVAEGEATGSGDALDMTRALAVGGGARTWVEVAEVFRLSAIASRLGGDEGGASQFFETEGEAWLRAAGDVEAADLPEVGDGLESVPGNGLYRAASVAFAEAFFAQVAAGGDGERLGRLAEVSLATAERAFGSGSEEFMFLEERLRAAAPQQIK
ncbi:MAG: hypothetical protein MPK06_02715 [Alphaproteobacteria bacterium]|nr:hypothetical protein [Alphaproteobacteria bacterium]MDA8005439.1 hypothetical protein [Alphaproteobacteria bacterium]MDA8013160.1 hypothetical protein [Alphaproteobacteria bacterium]